MTGDNFDKGEVAAAVRELVDVVMRSVSGVDGEVLWESEDEMWDEAIDEPHRSLLRRILTGEGTEDDQ